MCGIWACFATTHQTTTEKCVNSLKARGPEHQQILQIPNHNVTLGFTRLAINGLSPSGMQPMQYNQYTWICNGEIYNWRALKAEFNLETVTDTSSDCAVIGPLFSKFTSDPCTFFQLLDGVFAIVIYDSATHQITVGRDPYGVRPLFYSPSPLAYASEIKALTPLFTISPSHTDNFNLPIYSFPPSHYQQFSTYSRPAAPIPYHIVPFLKNPALSTLDIATQQIRDALIASVNKRVTTTERPIAALLSGGIDSSLIAALVQQELKRLGKPPLETYSIGFAGSSDLFYASKVAAHIGSKHTEIVTTPDEFFNAIPEVIRKIESYDITTIRASVGNYLVSKYISEHSEAKVIFNGDGADEIFGSYLYFYRAPTDTEFELETQRLLKDIYLYDVLRSDRSISSNGLEARTPFLDRQFVQVAMSVPTPLRRPSKIQPEKYILRKAFEEVNILPLEVLWRRKEAFSDGVSSKEKAWYEEIKERVPSTSTSAAIYLHNPPKTPEAKYYRDLFTVFYPGCAKIIPYFWMPKWSGETTDPSAKTLSIY
jgi:asparagine synthase (glutamine-hydrolysing)